MFGRFFLFYRVPKHAPMYHKLLITLLSISRVEVGSHFTNLGFVFLTSCANLGEDCYLDPYQLPSLKLPAKNKSEHEMLGK